MCGSPYMFKNNEPDNWLGGPYQVYPVDGELPKLSEKWGKLDLETIKKMFPDRLEAYCVFALIAAAQENQGWAGATYDYIDRIVGRLVREHQKTAWKKLGRLVWSVGRTNELSWTDVFVLLFNGSFRMFWGSMKRLVVREYVRVEKKEIDFVEVDVFFPTRRLVNKINCSL